jgi:hypothetical protein
MLKFNTIFYKNITGGESQKKIDDRRPVNEDEIWNNFYIGINI